MAVSNPDDDSVTTPLLIKASQSQQDLKWAKIWCSKFASFHQQEPRRDWDFTPDDVVAFLRAKRDARTPAWKRMKIVHGLLVYRRFVQEKPIDEFRWIRDKMKQIILIERARDEGYDSIEESVGHIDPKEPDVIQEFRRALRRGGAKLRTERSYVGKVRAPAACNAVTYITILFQRICERQWKRLVSPSM